MIIKIGTQVGPERALSDGIIRIVDVLEANDATEKIAQYCGDRLDVIAEKLSSFHSYVSLYSPSFWSDFENGLKKTFNGQHSEFAKQLERVSFHIGYAVSSRWINLPKEKTSLDLIPGLDGATESDLISLSTDKIPALKKMFPRVLVENLNYNPDYPSFYDRITDPEFIHEYISSTGAGMLLDIGHAVITARTSGYKRWEDYVYSLPLSEVEEIHMSRPEGTIDAHLIPDKEIKSIIRDVVSEIRKRGNQKELLLMAETRGEEKETEKFLYEIKSEYC